MAVVPITKENFAQEVLQSEKLPTPVRRVGVQDKFGCSGPAWDLLKLYGLDAATICKTAHEMLD